MPKLRAAKKSVKKNQINRQRNKAATTVMRRAIKRVQTAEDAASAQEQLSDALSILDRSIKKGVLHRNTGARYKSDLVRYVRNLD